LIVDATLQRRQRYQATVAPRVRHLVATWPDAATTAGFLERLSRDDISAVIRWSGSERLEQISAIAGVFRDLGIDTVQDLRDRLTGGAEGAKELRSALRKIRNVGPKTVDYIAILAGDPTAAAVDVRVRRVLGRAGIAAGGYDEVRAVVHAAASKRGWRLADLDAVIWQAGA